MEKNKIYALIPIKLNSDRVHGKNLRLMNNKPLFYYIIHTLKQSKFIDKIIINIDDKIIESKINEYFDDIEFYYRPKHLEGGNIPTNKLFIDMIIFILYEILPLYRF